MSVYLMIVASQLTLSNHTYGYRRYSHHPKEWKTFAERKAGLEDLRTLMANFELADEPSPIFDFFHWRRIVVDEGHEFVSDTTFSGRPFQMDQISYIKIDSIASIQADYRWYVTGTPFPNTYISSLLLF